MKKGLYKIVRNKADGSIYHVSTMQHPILGWWETAVFPHPGPLYMIQPVRGETILDIKFVQKVPLVSPRDHRLAELAKLGPKGVHNATVKRVQNEQPHQWKMTSDELEKDKQEVLEFIDAREPDEN
jgi:hypothetical protein